MMDSTRTAAGHGLSAISARTWITHLALTLIVSLLSGAAGFYIQTKQNQADAQEHIAVIAKRVGRQIVERMQHYEYGLRGARGVAIAADGLLTRAAFSRYAASRQIDVEFPGGRGFGVVLRVPQEEESAFVQTTSAGCPRLLDSKAERDCRGPLRDHLRGAAGKEQGGPGP